MSLPLGERHFHEISWYPIVEKLKGDHDSCNAASMVSALEEVLLRPENGHEFIAFFIDNPIHAKDSTISFYNSDAGRGHNIQSSNIV